MLRSMDNHNCRQLGAVEVVSALPPTDGCRDVAVSVPPLVYQAALSLGHLEGWLEAIVKHMRQLGHWYRHVHRFADGLWCLRNVKPRQVHLDVLAVAGLASSQAILRTAELVQPWARGWKAVSPSTHG